MIHEEILISQYRECYEYLRLRDKELWQIPSITTIIDGTLIAIALRYIEDVIGRLIILSIALTFTVALLIATIRHKYFAMIEQASLDKIENELRTKHIQRMSYLQEDADYWSFRYPRLLEKYSASEVLVYVMYLITALILILLLYSIHENVILAISKI